MADFEVLKMSNGRLRVFPGVIKAGVPTQSGELYCEEVDVYTLLGGNENSVCIKVSGDSMKDAGILSGDIVMVDPMAQPRECDIVAARLDGEETLKYFHKNNETHRIELIPANANYAPIVIENGSSFEVIGVVTGVMRRMRTPQLQVLGRMKKLNSQVKIAGEISAQSKRRMFTNCLLVPPPHDEAVRVFHSLIDGHHGKDVALVIKCAIETGIMRTPTYAEVVQEFPLIGSKTNFYAQVNHGWWTEDDKENIKKILKEKILKA